MMNRLCGLILIVGALLGSALACDKNETPAIMTQEDKALLERVKAKETARSRLEASPADFIRAKDWESYDSGFINTYTQTTAIEFSNESAFDVTDIGGRIIYLGKDGAELASMPFKAVGELPTKKKLKLKVTSGEITGKATKARILVESVRIRG